MWFLYLACSNTSASAFGDGRKLNVKGGILVLFTSRQRCFVEQNNVFELPHDNGYDMSLHSPAHRRSHSFAWIRFELSRYLDYFNTRLMSCIMATSEPGRKRQKHGAVLVDRKLPEVPGILVDRESVSLSEGKSQVGIFLTFRFSANLENSPTTPPEEVGSIHVLSSDLDVQADLPLAGFEGKSRLR